MDGARSAHGPHNIQEHRNRHFLTVPPQAQRLRQVAQEEERTVSELLREAIRLYMEEREWRVKERRQRRSRQVNTDETEAR